MRHLLVLIGLSIVFLGGCDSMPKMGGAEDMGPPTRPEVPVQMAMLERMLGEWEGEAEMIQPSAEEMNANLPEGAEPMPSTFKGGNTASWMDGGLFLKQEGWYEMPGGDRVTYVEYVTWDAKKGKFHSWFFSDWGESGEGWFRFTPDGDTANGESEGHDAEGNKKTGRSTMTYLDDKTVEWTWVERGPMGKMKMRGTSHKK